MSQTRRDFIKTVGAAGIVVAGSDLIADLLAQTPPGRVMDSKFKGLSDIALKEAKAGGCSYADIRFTRSTSSGVNATGGNPVPGSEDDFGGFGGRGGRGGPPRPPPPPAPPPPRAGSWSQSSRDWPTSR